MNALTAHINAADARRNLHYCPCCRDRYDASDMDLAGDWEHSAAMRAKYGAACCNGCTDDHLVTDDGECLPRSYARYSEMLDAWFSSDAAEAEALDDLRAIAADRRMYAGWR